jgi:hypothetical protein
LVYHGRQLRPRASKNGAHAASGLNRLRSEGAFQQRRFADVRQYLARLRAQDGIAESLIGSLRLVLEHWS